VLTGPRKALLAAAGVVGVARRRVRRAAKSRAWRLMLTDREIKAWSEGREE